MDEAKQTISIVINTPAEHVWPLLIEPQQFPERRYIHVEPEGTPTEGQVVHVKIGFLRMAISIDSVTQATPPLVGQTIHSRITFLGQRSRVTLHWIRDDEHCHLQSQTEYKYLGIESKEHTDTYCAALESALCVVIYTKQSNTSLRFLPRWLNRQINRSEAETKATARAIESHLQKIKTKAELQWNQLQYTKKNIK